MLLESERVIRKDLSTAQLQDGMHQSELLSAKKLKFDMTPVY